MALTKCKECGNELSTKADACPKCGAKVVKTSLAAKGCLTLILGIVGLAVIGALLGDQNSGSSSSSTASMSTPDTPPERPAPPPEQAEVVPLGTLLGQYKDNEIRADGLFKGKVIQTSGKVDDVKKDIMGSIFVTVGTGRQFEVPQVQCFFDDSQASVVSQLTKGASVTVQGRVDGLMMNVLVKECQLVSR